MGLSLLGKEGEARRLQQREGRGGQGGCSNGRGEGWGWSEKLAQSRQARGGREELGFHSKDPKQGEA